MRNNPNHIAVLVTAPFEDRVEIVRKKRGLNKKTVSYTHLDVYKRQRLGATGKIAFAKDNAIKFFKGGNFPEARKFAADVLNMRCV